MYPCILSQNSCPMSLPAPSILNTFYKFVSNLQRMKADAKKYTTVDEYISDFPAGTKSKLKELRKIIKKIAPKADEKISYNMPGYSLNGMLVYFAGYKNHIGFYPTSSGILAFKKEISSYKNSKGAIQFPLDEPLPVELISQIVEFRVGENMQKPYTKATKKTSKTV